MELISAGENSASLLNDLANEVNTIRYSQDISLRHTLNIAAIVIESLPQPCSMNHSSFPFFECKQNGRISVTKARWQLCTGSLTVDKTDLSLQRVAKELCY